MSTPQPTLPDDRRRDANAGRRLLHGVGLAVLGLAATVAGPLGRLGARCRRAVGGDRPFAAAIAGLLVLGVVVLSGPAQSYLDGRERVEALERKATALDAENGRLAQRVEDLHDPLNIELTARETQGFIRPGEVPYALVPPEVDRPQITAPRTAETPDERPWHRRAWERIRGLLT